MPDSHRHYDDAAARAALYAGALMGLHLWAEAVLGESQRQAPIEEGTLRGSGTIEEHGDELWIVYPLVYAAYQHEGHRADGTYVVQNHPKGGKIKYLEDPVKQFAPQLPAAIAAGQRRALARLR